jgi:hypothetical protein
VTTNVFFNNFESYSEQTLIEDLIIESIRIYGHEVYYCPRKLESVDSVFNEDALSSYNTAYLIEMYIKNVEGFEGEGDFLSKFNIQIRDEITFTLAQRVYNNTIGAEEVNTRPREGDLIYLPLTQKVYVIKFVEHEGIFYQMGKLQTYDLRCELFEYSNEDLNTGIPYIDQLEEDYSINVGINNYADTYANGDIIINSDTGRANNISNTYNLSSDPFADNDTFDTQDTFIDFTEIDPFSEGSF